MENYSRCRNYTLNYFKKYLGVGLGTHHFLLELREAEETWSDIHEIVY